ncbi:MAG: heavy metal translocating P-type ATPase, partial [Gammaproteobacteria bacterium]
MIGEFRRRFWICLLLTLPILWLSPMLRHALGVAPTAFAGSDYVLAALSSVIYFYGGWPFLQGLASELARRLPGMMTL